MTIVDLEPRRSERCTPAEAETLSARVMAASGDVARQEAIFLTLVGEFDAVNAVAYWDGLRSTAHWLSWACSIAPCTAREHVRVARALRRMPDTAAAFAMGELTYSKVREITRLVDEITTADGRSDVDAEETRPSDRVETADSPAPGDQPATADASESVADPFRSAEALSEARVVRFAQACTASQLARSVTGYRQADGSSRKRRSKQRVAWVTDEDGNLRLTAVLPPEEGAAVIAAIQAATDANQQPTPKPGDECPDDQQPDQSPSEAQREAQDRTRVEAVCEIANHYLASRPEDRSGEDRTMVVLEINASALEPATLRASVPAGTSLPAEAEHPKALSQKCRVRGGAGIEVAAGRRALCDAPVVGMIIDDLGEPLAVGRTERLVTRAQRRALMSRDGTCQYPGCLRRRRLKAHHRISWLDGGPTDLDNLILLCQWHHTRVHEDEISISRCDHPDCAVRWWFIRSDGTSIAPAVAAQDQPYPWRRLIDNHGRPLTGPARESAIRRNDERVAAYESRDAALAEQAAQLQARYGHINHTRHPDARRVFPVGGGEGFILNECVDALFRMTTPRTRPAA